MGLLALAGAEPVGHGVLVCTRDGRGELAFEVAAADNADMLAVLREHGPHAETRDGTVVTLTIAVPASGPLGLAPPAR